MIKFKLKELMTDRQVTIKEVSEYTGISRNTLSNMYNGKTNGIQFDNLNLLVDFFNCSIEDIIHHVPGRIMFSFIRANEEVYLHYLTEFKDYKKRIKFDVEDNNVFINYLEDSEIIMQQMSYIHPAVLELFNIVLVDFIINQGQLKKDFASVLVYHIRATRGLNELNSMASVISLRDGAVDTETIDHYIGIIEANNKGKLVDVDKGVVRIDHT